MMADMGHPSSITVSILSLILTLVIWIAGLLYWLMRAYTSVCRECVLKLNNDRVHLTTRNFADGSGGNTYRHLGVLLMHSQMTIGQVITEDKETLTYIKAQNIGMCKYIKVLCQ